MLDVDHGTGRHDQLYGPVAARVARNGAVGEVEHRVVGGRGGHAVGAVARALRLRAGAVVVEDDALAAHHRGAVDAVPLVRHYAVVLDPVLERVLAVGDLRDLGAHAPLGVVHELLAGADHGVEPVAVQKLVQAPFGDRQRADHGVKVAPRRARRAVVGEDDLPEVVDVLAAAHDLHRRQPQTLLVDLAGVGGESAHRLAADLGEVGDVADEAVQLATVVHRLDHRVLGQVAAAAVGIVVHHHVAGGEVLQPHLGDGPLHGVEDRPDLGRAELGVGDHLRVAVEHHAGEVETLIEDRGVGGLHHRQPHLAAGVDQVVVDDGEGDAVQRLRHRSGLLGRRGRQREDEVAVRVHGQSHPVRHEGGGIELLDHRRAAQLGTHRQTVAAVAEAVRWR